MIRQRALTGDTNPLWSFTLHWNERLPISINPTMCEIVHAASARCRAPTERQEGFNVFSAWIWQVSGAQIKGWTPFFPKDIFSFGTWMTVRSLSKHQRPNAAAGGVKICRLSSPEKRTDGISLLFLLKWLQRTLDPTLALYFRLYNWIPAYIIPTPNLSSKSHSQSTYQRCLNKNLDLPPREIMPKSVVQTGEHSAKRWILTPFDDWPLAMCWLLPWKNGRPVHLTLVPCRLPHM